MFTEPPPGTRHCSEVWDAVVNKVDRVLLIKLIILWRKDEW